MAFWDDLAKSIFGSNDEPGALGLGYHQVDKHDIDKGNFQDPHSEGMRRNLQAQTAHAAGRQAQQVQAAQQDSVREYGGARVDPYERSARAALGSATSADSARIDRSQDAQGRAAQLAFISSLQDQAAGRGPSLATLQMRQGMDRAQAQAMGAAQAMGGSSALAQRNLAANQAQAARQAGLDAAALRTQEQLNAQGQLGNAVAALRGQDAQLATSQAGFDQQANLATADAQNRRTLQQGQMDLANTQFNATQGNQRAALQAQLVQQAQLGNRDAYNAMLAQNTAFRQQANLANQEAYFKQLGLNDAQVRYLLDAQLQQNDRDRAANMEYERMRTQQDIGMAPTDLAAYRQAADARSAFIASLTQGNYISPFTGEEEG